MKNIILGIAGIAGVAIVGVLGMAASKPSTIAFERSITVNASEADVAPFLQDLRKVNEWSPWNERDPDLEQTYSESTTGEGAWYAWSGNEDVGSGRQSIASVAPGEVVHDLHFTAPFDDKARSALRWEAQGEQVQVTWAFEKDSSDFGTKVMQVFMDLESMIGPDYEHGLALLKPLAEGAAAERAEAEEAAAAEAEAAEETDVAEGTDAAEGMEGAEASEEQGAE